jgi:hypothetical protein
MAGIAWLIGAFAVLGCVLVGLVGGVILFGIGVVSKAAKGIGRRAPTKFGVFELNGAFDRKWTPRGERVWSLRRQQVTLSTR